MALKARTRRCGKMERLDCQLGGVIDLALFVRFVAFYVVFRWI